MAERTHTTISREVSIPDPGGRPREVVTDKGKGHKERNGVPVSSDFLHQFDATTTFHPQVQGGILRKDGYPVAAVRPPGARKSPAELTYADIQPMYMHDKEGSEMKLENTDTGLEAEYFGFDPKTGETVPMMNKGDDFRTALDRHNQKVEETGKGQKIEYTVEMMRNCVELTYDHGKDPEERNRHYLDSLQALVSVSEQSDVNVLIAPMGTIPHRNIKPRDITDDEYTHDMTFVKQGWKAAQHFDIASFQPHAEIINHEAARQTMNHLQHLMPILFVPTLDGPFIEGEIAPDAYARYQSAPTLDADPLKIATLDAMEQGEHHSYRHPGRVFGSPSGGLLRVPIPVDEGEYLNSIGTKLEEGIVNSVGREGGHHTDRYRVDIGPHGTIELCSFDPAGGRIQRVVAMREFTKTLAWKMQMHFVNGDFPEKAGQFPELFGKEPSQESFETAHWNMLKVAKEGAKAELEGMDGNTYEVRTLWRKLLDFVQEPLVDEEKGIYYQGMPPALTAELSKGFIDPSALFEKYRDAETGITSSRGYLETGIGTSSQWRMQAAKDGVEAGMTDQEAIMAGTIDVGKSFHQHVKETTLDDIQAMYEMPNKPFEVKTLPAEEARTYWDKLLEKNLVPVAGDHLLQMGHPTELPSAFVEEFVAGSRATHDYLLGRIKEVGVTEHMKANEVMFGPYVLNSESVNRQLDARLTQGYGIPMEFDGLMARGNGEIYAPTLEIHTAISYEPVLAERLKAAGYDPTAPNTRFGSQSPADIYSSFSELFAGGEPIVVMDTFPFDSTRPDKVGMQKMMGGADSLPISPLDIVGKDEGGYYYHPYIEDPKHPLDAVRDDEGNPLKDETKKEYVKHAFARMAQFDLDVLWETIQRNPDKEKAKAQTALVTQFLLDGEVNWIWHPTWQHLGDKKMMPEVRKVLVADGNPAARQYGPIYGPGERVEEPGRYIKKPTSAQHGVDQTKERVEKDEDVIVPEGYVYQTQIMPAPVLSYVNGQQAEEMRRTDQTTLRSIDRTATDPRPITGQLEVRALTPPYWRTDSEMPGRFMTRYAPRWTQPEKHLRYTQTNAAGITNALHEHLASTQDHENHILYPYGMAPVVVVDFNN